jgi:hypothetical protein
MHEHVWQGMPIGYDPDPPWLARVARARGLVGTWVGHCIDRVRQWDWEGSVGRVLEVAQTRPYGGPTWGRQWG